MGKKTKPLDPVKVLGTGIASALSERRSQGGRYPCSLRELGQSVQPNVSDAELLAATKVAPLKSTTVLALNGDATSSFCLKEDLDRLVADENLLRELLVRQASPEIPLVSLKDLASLLTTPALRTSFARAWNVRIAEGRLPSFVRVVSPPGPRRARPAVQLHDVRYPLPWEEQSRRLLAALESRGDTLPTIAQLVAAIGPTVTGAALKLALQTAPFCDNAAPVFPKEPLGPQFLLRDAEAAARRPGLIRIAVQRRMTEIVKAAAITKFAAKGFLHPRLQPGLVSNLEARIESNGLPPGVGALRIKTWHLFLTEDVRGGQVAPEPAFPSSTATSSHATVTLAPTPRRESFALAFEAAFETLDRQTGNRNFLKLQALREALRGFSRAEFDAGLTELRRARRFSLEASEGSMTKLTDAEREAGIMEGGNNLVYCRRVR